MKMRSNRQKELTDLEQNHWDELPKAHGASEIYASGDPYLVKISKK